MNKKKKTRLIRITLFVATVLSLFFVPWILVWTWMQPLPDTVQEQVDDAIELGFEGMIVYVDQGGQEPDHYAAGWKNRETKIPADPQSLFKIASIGKLYDAVAITRLVGDDSLSLDDTLTDHFPELAGKIEYADEITIRMMVQHRSGIPNLTNTPNFWTDPPENNEEALERVIGLPASFEPGDGYEYSNTNYLLLNMLVENVSGMSHFEYIKREILEPLGLQNTFGSIHDVNMGDVMSGYYAGVEEDIKTVDYASMLATAEDVGIFLRALNDGSLFDEGEQEIYSSIYRYEHTGLIPGYQSIAKYHEDIDTVIIQFTNTTNFEGYQWSLSEIVYDRIVEVIRRSTG